MNLQIIWLKSKQSLKDDQIGDNFVLHEIQNQHLCCAKPSG